MSNVHLVGIGGVGMAGLAVLLKSKGHNVSGCDLSSTPRTQWLERNGIPVFVGHSPEHLHNAEMVIATPAVHNDNPEIIAAGSNLRFRGEVLAEIVSQHNDTIVVCGSHGKTTTSTFIAKLLRGLGENVSWAIGGETGSFPVASSGDLLGESSSPRPLVVEADESDGTLAFYHSTTLVVTNCEYDHPDFFKTPESYFACYETAKKQAKTVLEVSKRWEVCEKVNDLSHDILEVLKSLAPHNRINARAAIEIALNRGYKEEEILRVLPSVVFELPDRRFQYLWHDPDVITDYAHHPTEMGCAIQMARNVCKGKLRVLFQPHRYSRTKALLNDFPKSFVGADEVVLCPTYPAFERPIEGGSIADLYKVCRDAKIDAKLFLAKTCKEAWKHAFFEMQKGDVTLLLGAGDIIKLSDDIKRDMPSYNSMNDSSRGIELSQYSFFRTGGRSIGGGNRHIIGMGSNTWISDLTTDEEYVKYSNPADAPGATLGIPWMVGIPGTIGGWVKMNAGAFGHSISEVIEKVKVDGVWISKEDCHFAYRSSLIDGVIEDVIISLAVNNILPSKDTANEYLSRRKHFPPRCCGSVFKNPSNDYAGRLLEEVGVKDLSVGGAYVWQEHANVIFAKDDATSSDILALACLMRDRVFHRFNVLLEFEIQGL